MCVGDGFNPFGRLLRWLALLALRLGVIGVLVGLLVKSFRGVEGGPLAVVLLGTGPDLAVPWA